MFVELLTQTLKTVDETTLHVRNAFGDDSDEDDVLKEAFTI